MTESIDPNQTAINDLLNIVGGMFSTLSDNERDEFRQFVTSFVNADDITVTLTEDGDRRQLEGKEATRTLIAGTTHLDNNDTDKIVTDILRRSCIG